MITKPNALIRLKAAYAHLFRKQKPVDKTASLLWCEQNNWQGIRLYSNRAEALEKSGDDIGFYILYGDGYKWVNVSDIPVRPNDN